NAAGVCTMSNGVVLASRHVGRCSCHDDGPADHRDSPAGRRATDLAVQQRLGLLPERRAGTRPPHPHHPHAGGTRVARALGGLGGPFVAPHFNEPASLSTRERWRPVAAARQARRARRVTRDPEPWSTRTSALT